MDHDLFKSGSTNLVRLNLKYFNHWKPGYKYIAGDNLEIDQIFDNKLNDLFHEEKIKNKDEFTRDFASSVQKVYESYFNKIISHILLINYSKNLVYSGGCASKFFCKFNFNRK